MRRTLTIAAIAVLVLVAIAKLVAAPSKVAAGTDTSVQPTISTYDLDTRISRNKQVAGRGSTAALAGYGISG